MQDCIVKELNWIEFNGTIADLQKIEILTGLLIIIENISYKYLGTDQEKKFVVHETILIGHVNSNGGCCNCCDIFKNDPKVLKYARILDSTIL